MRASLRFTATLLTIFVLSLSIGALSAAPVSVGESGLRPKVGLVLSGGGARGFAHIGALKALEELCIPFDVITATSMGAMVGGAYAAGYSADDIRKITLDVDWTKMFAPRPDRKKLNWQAKEDDRRGLGFFEVGVDENGLRFPSEVIPSHELGIFLGRATQPFNTINDLNQLAIPFAAMATNLVTGERVVLNRRVTLAQAMRASMSIPGAFAPVPWQGLLLVDGGLVDNMPVGEARNMGADVVVAVNVGTPLSGREELTSVGAIMGQVVNLLTEQNVKTSIDSLTDRDIYIKPRLDGYSSSDFNKAAEIMKVGYEAVMQMKRRLQVFAVPPETYQRWLSARAERVLLNPEHVVESVEVVGLKTVNPERVRGSIGIRPGHIVTNEEVAEAARDVWGTGDFQGVPFRFEPGPRGTEVVVFEPTEKDWGYSSLKFGGNLQSDLDGENTFNVLLAHSWGWLNSWGGEWRNEIQGGEVKRAASEWYQPLGPSSNWFLRPSVSYEWSPFNLYADYEEPIARFRNEQFDTHLMLGYEIGKLGRVWGQAGWFHSRTKQEIGLFDVKITTKAKYLGVGVQFDTLDNPSFPRAGFGLKASVMQTIEPNVDGAEEQSEMLYALDVMKPVPLGERSTLLLAATLGKASQTSAFNLGGVFRLSGTPYGRFTGNRLELARVLFYHDASRVMREMKMPLYLGFSLEAGRAWNKLPGTQLWGGEDDWKRAASLYAASDTWFGPVYLVFGRTFGYSDAVTLYWGRLF